MTLLERVRSARAMDPARFVPFVVDGCVIGRVRRDLAARLGGFPGIFALGATGWMFAPELRDERDRSDAMMHVARVLSEEGRLTRWRDETYDIGTSFGAPRLFAIERSAVRFFGFESYAVHVNGVVGAGALQSMWIARRSPSKPIDPGMLDNMVGGGLASGLSVQATLLKETWEEAGIDAALAAKARAAGAIRVTREVPEGLHAETIFVYDLTLSEQHVPSNQDGEVAQFRKLSVDEVRRELGGGAQYTADAALVIVHFLVRHGHVTADDEPDLVTAAFL